jgi:hypothetical protein
MPWAGAASAISRRYSVPIWWAEAARAAVDHHYHLAFFEAEGAGGLGVEDLRDVLDLEIVVARAERAHPPALAQKRALGDEVGAGAGHCAPLLDARSFWLT